MSGSDKAWGGRFSGATAELMERFNASIGFDRRPAGGRRRRQQGLRPRPGAGRPAHDGGVRPHPRGPRPGPAGAVGARPRVGPRPGGRAHGRRGPAHQDPRPPGRQAARRPQPQRPGQPRRAPLPARRHGGRRRAHPPAAGGPGGLRRGPSPDGAAGVHAPAAGPADRVRPLRPVPVLGPGAGSRAAPGRLGPQRPACPSAPAPWRGPPSPWTGSSWRGSWDSLG